MSEVIGKIIVLNDTQVVGSDGTFRKRTLVIETDEQYKQTIPIDFVQDKCDILNNYAVGENVKVSINIRGNEYQGKYFCSIQGWRIEKIQEPHHSDHPTNMPPVNQAATQPYKEDEPDDSPF